MNATQTHAEALELLARMTTAPDHTTWVNLVEELQQRYLAQASIVDMLAASNETWAQEAQQKRQAVEAFITDITELYGETITDTDSLKELAEAFDIPMKREFGGFITVTYRVDGVADRKFDADQIGGYLDIIKEPKFDGVIDGITVESSEFHEVLSTEINFN